MNEYKVVLTTDNDLQDINQWLVGWRLNPLPLVMYPKTGIMVQVGEQKAMAGFVWATNSGVAQLGFITRNPEYRDKKQIKQIKKCLLSALILLAKDLGFEYVMTWTANQSLVSEFKAMGFDEASNKVSELIGKIQ